MIYEIYKVGILLESDLQSINHYINPVFSRDFHPISGAVPRCHVTGGMQQQLPWLWSRGQTRQELREEAQHGEPTAMGTSWDNPWKIMGNDGKSWENHGK